MKLLPVYYSLYLSAYPLPCLNGCFCFYSIEDDANTVNCSHKNMTQLPDNLLPNTEQLIMVGNDLKTINSVAKDLPHLVSLDLEKCNISEISTQALQALLLYSDNLKLSNNKLQGISSIIKTTKYNTTIWLSKNIFECNCNIMWMRDWLLNATNVMDKDNITCVGGKWNGLSCLTGTS